MAFMSNGRSLGMAKRDCLSAIDLFRKDIKDYLKELKSASSAFGRASRGYKTADEAYIRSSGRRNERRLDRAGETFRAAADRYNRIVYRITRALESLEAEYEKLFEIYEASGNESALNKARTELEEYKLSVENKIARNDRSGGAELPSDILKTEYIDEAEACALEYAEGVEDEYTSETAGDRASVASVNLAPINIDVTPIVESAINAAIDKLSEGLDKRIAEYVSGVSFPECVTPATVATSSVEVCDAEATVDTKADILEEEERIAKRLSTLCSSLGELLNGLDEVARMYHEVADRERAILDEQKAVRDMQRRILRDQQGVRVNQKLLCDEQGELAIEQTLILEKQRTSLEEQKKIKDMTASISEGGEAVAEAIKVILDRQSALASIAEELNTLALKTQDNATATLERQNEIHASQKAILAKSRKLLRESKPTASKKVRQESDTDSKPTDV